MLAGGKPDLKVLERQGPTDGEALDVAAGMPAQPRNLARLLRPLAERFKAEPVRDRNDRLRDRFVVWIREQTRDEAAVDLDDVDRQTLEDRERGIPGAEVVDGDTHVQFAQGATDAARGLHVAHRIAFRDLDAEIRQAKAVAREIRERAHELRVAGLAPRKIEVEAESGSQGAQDDRCRAGVAQHPIVDRGDDAALLGKGDEGCGREQAARWVVPADERLAARDHTIAGVDVGLIVQHEFVAVDGVCEFVAQCGPANGVAFHAGFVAHDAAVSVPLRL